MPYEVTRVSTSVMYSCPPPHKAYSPEGVVDK